MSQFDTNPKSLKDLLTQIDMGELALPDFQRDFVWDPGATKELIESIIRRYPAGSLLFLKHDGAGFQIREFAGATKPALSQSTSYLVLDGQQRLTSLYQAFYGKGEHRFYLDLNILIDGGDIEDAVFHENFKRSERQGMNTIEYQAESLICPLAEVFGPNGVYSLYSWISRLLEKRPEKGNEANQLRDKLERVFGKWIAPILDYHFPVITLSATTPLEAVCKMFETLNRGGVKLTVFELLMARAFADKVSLRQLWEAATRRYPEFEEFGIDPYYVLQIISLISKSNIKRSEVLELDPKVISRHWEAAIHAFGETLRFARQDLGILSGNFLPYNTMLVPMVAVWIKMSELKGAAIAAAKEKLTQWFWASVFSQTYDKAASSRAVADYKQLNSWLFDSGEEPSAFRKLEFSPAHFFEVTVKQRALYRGTLALVLSGGAKDFHKGDVIRYDYLVDNKVDDHHIFPRSFLKKKSVPDQKINCVLNRTLIDKVTNIRISDNAPSKYLKEITKELGVEASDEIFYSHQIPRFSLETDDFEGFLESRAKLLFAKLKDKVKRDIPESVVPFDDEDDTDEEEEYSIRDRVDPSLVNLRPAELLEDQPKWVEDKFNELTVLINRLSADIWWRQKKHRVSFFSPQKHFMSVKISRNGLRLLVFTRDKTFSGVEPILHKNLGGKLWGKVKVGKDTPLADIEGILQFSLKEMQDAIKAGENTAWWAVANKMKSGAA
jgi:hypothetical protein